MSGNLSRSCWRAKWTLIERSLISLGSEKSYRHPSHSHDPSGLFLFTASASLPVHLQHHSFHCYLPDFCSKPFYLLVLSWIPTKVREYTHHPLKKKSLAQINCRVCSHTFFPFSLFGQRVQSSLPLLGSLFEQLFLSMVVISPSPIPASVFYSQSLRGKGSLLCTVADGVELHTHRQSVPGNPKKTEKAASLLEGVTSAHLHILTGDQVLLM